ncbi:helix-turn-helix domain-containing protein [Actinacidiphila glaucinigra]|uniref:helix-turn-helix domain-containing protein n=1 Tax=Actinacidiphila glaucinigra TaxID=235986 RepID=UPI00386A4124
MGRTENPVDRTIAAVADLADYQRTLRAAAGLTYTELASATGVPATTLRRAASGRCVPDVNVVLAAVTACGGTPRQARTLWKKARYHQRLAHNPRPASPTWPLVRDKADLAAALVEMYEQAGAPPVAMLEQRAGLGRLGHSTAHRIINRQTLPAHLGQLEAFLDALQVENFVRRQQVLRAWDRVSGIRSRRVARGWQRELNQIITQQDLTVALAKLRIQAGTPSHQEIASFLPAPLGRQSVASVLRGDQTSPATFEAILTALDVQPEELQPWIDAWDRVMARLRGRAA